MGMGKKSTGVINFVNLRFINSCVNAMLGWESWRVILLQGHSPYVRQSIFTLSLVVGGLP